MRSTNDFQKAIQRLAAEYQNLQTVRLGKLDGVTVETGTDGLLWARQWNGKEIKVHNRAYVPADFDLRILVGTYRTQPGKWFILQIMEDYLTPAAGGRLGYHHTQHEFMGPDMVLLDRRQLLAFSLIVSDAANYLVQLYGGVFHSQTAITLVDSQTLDFSGYSVAGAKYIGVEVDDTGTVTLHEGDDFGSILAGSAAYIPIPAPGKYLIGYVALYDGQTALDDDDIRVIMPLGVIVRKSVVTTRAVDYTLTTADDVVVFTASATATLPAATGSGQTYRIIARNCTVTINADGTETIKGELTQTLTGHSDLILTDTASGIWE